MSKELIKRLRNEAELENCLLPHSGNETVKMLNEAADAIEELSMKLHGDEAAIAGMKREIERMVVAGKPRWIPVEERLPKSGQRVIVARPYEKGKPLRVEQGTYDMNGWWRVYGTNVKKVSFWMPMPEPPEVTNG